jgi:two-component system response regulator TctD
MRILLVEDHQELARWVAKAFRDRGLAVDHVSDGIDADNVLSTQDYALVVLDLTLPGLDGLEVLRRLRSRKQAMPVLVLTARGETVDRVHGLNAGADDYLTKPFALEELEVRIRSLLRRGTLAAGTITCGKLVFNENDRSFHVGGTPLMLTKTELSQPWAPPAAPVAPPAGRAVERVGEGTVAVAA